MKNFFIAVGVALVAIVGFGVVGASITDKITASANTLATAIETRNSDQSNAEGLGGLSERDIQALTIKLNNAVTTTWVSKTLPAGQNQVVLYRNTTGKDVWASYGDVTVPTGQTASSTSKVYMIATTSASVGTWADFGTIIGLKGDLLRGALFATSTTASTTSSTLGVASGRSNGTILIPNGSYLIAYYQQNIDVITGCRGAVGLCESATSTNRGANPVFRVRLDY